MTQRSLDFQIKFSLFKKVYFRKVNSFYGLFIVSQNVFNSELKIFIDVVGRKSKLILSSLSFRNISMVEKVV